MFPFLLFILKLIFFPLSAVKKEYICRIANMQLELGILKRKFDTKNKRIRFSWFQKLVYSLLFAFSTKDKSSALLVQPDTILKWYQKFLKKRWDYSVKRKPGRPATPGHIKELILQMKNDNHSWGIKESRVNC